MSALLFGSISTLADTSELQRQSFNRAFAEHGLDWNWDRDDYIAMLDKSGGRDRIAEYARSRGQDVDAQAVHQTKSELFRSTLAEAGVAARDGVVDTIRAAKDGGMQVALVTTTSPANVSSLLDALHLDFDLVVDSSDVQQPKPDKAAYSFALDKLGEDANDCVAIEDNVGGVQAATAAGLTCVAFPNENTAGHHFDTAARTVDHVDLPTLQDLIPSA